jgi:protein FAM32A
MSSKPAVIGGKLKLKGSGGSSSHRTATTSRPAASSSSSSTDTSSSEKKRIAETDVGGEDAAVVTETKAAKTSTDSYMTAAERRHLEKKKELETRLVKQGKGKTYRDRIDEFNSKLSVMSEHNDIPRVSAAGNG